MSIDVSDLDVGYGDLQVLRQAEVRLERGVLTAILGANGAGKTTLLNTLAGLIAPWRGLVLVDGREATRQSVTARLRSGIALVPQGRDLFGALTVRENLELGAYTLPSRGGDLQHRMERVLQLFPDLRAKLSSRAESLSGGQQQMVAIGRALMIDPPFLLLDEPSQGLGPLVVESVLRSLRTLASGGTGVVVAEQDGNAALKVADRCHVMRLGSFVWSGTSTEARKEGLLHSLYFGHGGN